MTDKEQLRTQSGSIPLTWVHTLVIGSGAAGLNAAIQLRANGVDDVIIVTEGLRMGTSINTGSDKQTYYKLSLCGSDADSPVAMAETFFAGGSMHGDLALVEASLSARAFINLVNLGVAFPRDAYGQFVGYKTDHDPRQRATSIGPYTSRDMCRALAAEVSRRGITVHEGSYVVELLAGNDGRGGRRILGAVTMGIDGAFTAYAAENIIFATGGPGGLYRTSVYPEVHTGGIGLALMAGATAANLQESQFGMASTGFRWNVSGTYMQVLPRFISFDRDGVSGEQEFLRKWFRSAGEMNSTVFLKGYQWPFDSRKAASGSSIIDILVHIETVKKNRRVFLDFRRNAEGFDFSSLSKEALDYLTKSRALQGTPIDRLRAMNPGAVDLYREHGIDIAVEPLEIAVCAQHNNGGLAANYWWESVNVRHFFPVGEVNGSHGVYRPGGAALNSGQVGGFRAAEYIANRYGAWSIDKDAARQAAVETVERLSQWISKCRHAGNTWLSERSEFQERMTRSGSHTRSRGDVRMAVSEAWEQCNRIETTGCRCDCDKDVIESLRNRHLCLAHAVYLDAISCAAESGVGSRGSAVVLHQDGITIRDELGCDWRIQPEDESFRDKVLETTVRTNGDATHLWIPRRPLPSSDTWFENAWSRFRSGAIFDQP